MKLGIVAAALLVGFIGGTAAHADDPTTWIGQLVATKASAGCAGTIQVGDEGTSTLKLQISGGFPAFTFRRPIADELFTIQTLTKPLPTSGEVFVTGLDTFANSLLWTGTYRFKMRPARPTDSTPEITATIIIGNFDDDSDCTVTLTGAYTLRP